MEHAKLNANFPKLFTVLKTIPSALQTVLKELTNNLSETYVVIKTVKIATRKITETAFIQITKRVLIIPGFGNIQKEFVLMPVLKISRHLSRENCASKIAHQ